MNIINPTQSNMSTVALVLRWAQSVYKALNGGLSFGQPTGQAASGVFNTFQQDNFGGVIIYVGSNGSGATVSWGTSNIGQSFNHGLLRQPIGFIPIYKSKACDVYSTVTPTSDTITLAVTDATAQVTLLIF